MPLPGEEIFPEAFRYPWRAGNRVGILNDGPSFFPRMLEAIEQARESILLELYLFESGRTARQFIQALCEAADRGVRVHLLLDSFGTRGLARQDRRMLTGRNVQVCHYNPLRLRFPYRNLARDHRKILLVDGRVAFIGGAGISDVFSRRAGVERNWRELMLEVQGPVTGDWHDLFAQVWRENSGASLPEWIPSSDPAAADPSELLNARVTCTRRLLRQEIRNSLLREVNRSRQRVWLATAYFVPSWSIRRALRAAAGRGLDVRILVPGLVSDHPSVTLAGRRYYDRLLRSGVRIFEYRQRFLHMKVTLADDWVTAGSCNLDHWTLRWNLEANQEVRDSGFARRIAAMLEEDFAQSVEVHPQAWSSRPWYRRLLERFFGWLDQLLTRIGN